MLEDAIQEVVMAGSEVTTQFKKSFAPKSLKKVQNKYDEESDDTEEEYSEDESETKEYQRWSFINNF